jgi:hypothetical protein
MLLLSIAQWKHLAFNRYSELVCTLKVAAFEMSGTKRDLDNLLFCVIMRFVFVIVTFGIYIESEEHWSTTISGLMILTWRFFVRSGSDSDHIRVYVSMDLYAKFFQNGLICLAGAFVVGYEPYYHCQSNNIMKREAGLI